MEDDSTPQHLSTPTNSVKRFGLLLGKITKRHRKKKRKGKRMLFSAFSLKKGKDTDKEHRMRRRHRREGRGGYSHSDLLLCRRNHRLQRLEKKKERKRRALPMFGNEASTRSPHSAL